MTWSGHTKKPANSSKCELELNWAEGKVTAGATGLGRYGATGPSLSAAQVRRNAAAGAVRRPAVLTLLYRRLSGVILVSIVQNKENAFFPLFFVG